MSKLNLDHTHITGNQSVLKLEKLPKCCNTCIQCTIHMSLKCECSCDDML